MFAAGYPAPELHVDSNLIHYRKMELIGTFSADKCDFERAAELRDMIYELQSED